MSKLKHVKCSAQCWHKLSNNSINNGKRLGTYQDHRGIQNLKHYPPRSDPDGRALGLVRAATAAPHSHSWREAPADRGGKPQAASGEARRLMQLSVN